MSIYILYIYFFTFMYFLHVYVVILFASSYPSSTLSTPVHDRAKVISSRPLSSVRHLAVRNVCHHYFNSMSCNSLMFLEKNIQKCICDLKERLPFFHEPQLTNQSRVTETQHSPAASQGYSAPHPPPPGKQHQIQLSICILTFIDSLKV